MQETGVSSLVFSSSATVYGNPESFPIHERLPAIATNPYGRSKLMVEEILRDLIVADDSWHMPCCAISTRWGSRKWIDGEDPAGIRITDAIYQPGCGRRRTELQIFGAITPLRMERRFVITSMWWILHAGILPHWIGCGSTTRAYFQPGDRAREKRAGSCACFEAVRRAAYTLSHREPQTLGYCAVLCRPFARRT